MNKIISLLILAVAMTTASGCATTSTPNSKEQKRQSIQSMKSDVLNELYALKPDVRSQISNAPGYAVFSNVNINIILASFGGGYGVVKNNGTGKNTYMRMGEVGVGFGAGVKDFRAVMVFHNQKALARFIDFGWAFGAQADAAAKASDKGAAASGEAIIDNITIYQITKSGLALQATIKGTKFWKDGSLN